MGRSTSALLVALALPLAQEKPPVTPAGRVQERVTVGRVVLTGRVIDRFANTISGLAPSDFRLRVDGREASIESVEWIPARSEPAPRHVRPESASEPAGQVVPPAPPRQIVLLFQWEIAGQKDTGFVRMMGQAKRLVESLGPEDRIAVFAFGSTLRLLQDFTTDHAAAGRAIERIRNPGWRGPAQAASGSGLSRAFDRCGPAESIETALVCVGNSLQEFPGPKTLLFFGWTAATTRGTWHVEYPAIIEAIGKAETSVFALDVSDGRHRLGAYLERLAADTGGLYNETFDFPDLARLRVERSLDGSYELVFRDPSIGRGWHEVEIALAGRAGTALFPRWYRDGPDVSSDDRPKGEDNGTHIYSELSPNVSKLSGERSGAQRVR